jgi:3-phenylpropionate/cinnamic acid dioxygenase small subunit
MSKYQITAIAALALCGAAVSYSQSTPKLTGDDYIEIQNLYANYAHALDEGKGDAFAATFTEDGEFTGQSQPGQPRRQPIKGKEALARMGGRGGGGSRHFMANLSVNPTPEGARASAYFIQYNTKDTPPSIFLLAVYDDTLVKTPQGWKFSKRVVYRDDDEMSPFKANPAAPGGGRGRGQGRGQGSGQGGGQQNEKPE